MKSLNMIAIGVAVLGLTGCASFTVAPPTEENITAEPFTIKVPKNLNNNETQLKGVQLNSFTNKWGRSPVRDFFSVTFKSNNDNSELITEACKGELHDSGLQHKSCLYFDSKVSINENDSFYLIEIKPFKKREVQGKNAIFLPIDLPVVNVDKLYEWLSKQSIALKKEYISKFPAESLKGNFDRNLTKYRWEKGESDAASKQFKDTYNLSINKEFSVKIGASIFPYKEGSIVKTMISGDHQTTKNTNTIDWFVILNNASDKIQNVASQ